MSEQQSAFATARRELLIFLSLLALGVLVMPIAVFLVGNVVFGAYAGDGLGGFLAGFGARLLSGETAAWFLALSPYIGISILRLIGRGWRFAGRLAT